MWRWLFKRGDSLKLSEIHSSVKASFANVHSDMAQLTQWINHFQQEHHSHKNELKQILQRVGAIEKRLATLNWDSLSIMNASDDESNDVDKKVWDGLTDLQQQLAWVLLMLDREKPEEWWTLKDLAEEFYLDKEYKSVRTTIVNYTSELEKRNIIEKKRTSAETVMRIKKKNLPSLRTEKGFLRTLMKKSGNKNI